MVNIMENPIKMDDLGGKNPIFGNNPIWLMLFKWLENRQLVIGEGFLQPNSAMTP